METDITLLKIQNYSRGSVKQRFFPCWNVFWQLQRSIRKAKLCSGGGSASKTWQCCWRGAFISRRKDYWGNLSILSEISAGEMFGEVYACLGSDEILNDAVAVKQSRVLFLNMKRILTMCPSACQFHGRLIRNLLSVLAVKNKVLTQKLEHMSKRTTRKSFCPICQNSLRGREARSLIFRLTGSRWQIICQWTGAPCPRSLKDERRRGCWRLSGIISD